MIDNRDYILPLLNFSDTEKFYFIQIYKRRKDNPDMDKDVKVLGNYVVYNLDDFNKKFLEIKKVCDDNNARAYIRLNRRSDKKIALQLLARLATMIASEQYNVRNAYWAVVGEFATETDKTWVLDIDYKDFEDRKAFLGVLHARIEELQIKTGREPMMHIIPTKNGYHLITRPFNIQSMGQFLKDNNARMDYHKDNPSILYIP
jgi:hypothetical protein